jgi:poly(3-hydroxyalkanoate) synthetase
LTPFLWPALAAATASEMVSALAKELAHCGPIFLLAGRDDEIVAPKQLLAARRLVGSKEIRTEVVACTHLGLCMGATTLLRTWPKIACWLAAP